MANKAVLLIGLGGIGSKIASKVYKEIPEELRKNVVVHIFDTDENEAKKLGLKQGDITLTSSELTVQKCLMKDNIRRSNVEEWFPTDQQSILSTKFTDGAGQVRAISRLAYMDSIGSGKLHTLESKLQKFSQMDGSNYSNDVRVMIVSSLAGGTGSGIFIQTALYLRDYFESRGKYVTIRGSFMLPDILIKNRIISGTHIRNTRANGYACLKELDAIIRSTMGSSEEHGVNIQLAYKPDMSDEKVTKLPYDFSYLYDYENLDGKHLGGYEHYISQLEKTIYLQLFSDIAGVAASDEINMLPHLTETKGRARYASAGVSTLVYPYENIVDYSANRLASENIGEKWLKIDRIFDHEMEEYESLKRQGIYRESPKKNIRMNDIFDNEVKNGDIFFKNLNRSLHILNKDNELGAKKTAEFIRAVEERVKNEVEDGREYKEFRNYTAPYKENLYGKAEEMKNEVSNFEAHLSKYKKITTNSIEDKKNLLFSNIVPIHLIEERDMAKTRHQLGYWLMGENDSESLNPIATRYFIYEIKNIIEDKIRVLGEDTRNLYELTERYSKDFGEDRSAIEVSSLVAEKSSGIFAIFSRGHKNFASEYEEKAESQMKKIGEYLHKKILLGVYEDILKSVNDMIENSEEDFFKVLKEAIADFRIKSQNLAKIHDDRTDVSKLYVLGTTEMKDKLFNEVSKNIDIENVLNGSYAEIFKEKYNRFISRRKNERNSSEKSLKDIYQDKFLNAYRDQIKKRSNLDMDIISAIRKEAEFTNSSIEAGQDHMVELVRNIKNRAKPFMQKQGVNSLPLWGINIEVLEQLTDEQKEDIFEDVDKIVKSEGFSKYEIIRYVSIHGLKAQDFEKFSSGSKESGAVPGEYFLAYREVIDKLNRHEVSVTPHLDKRWHLPAYMPDINDIQAKQDKIGIMRGFINGILYNYINPGIDMNGKSIWTFKDRNGSSKIIKSGNKEVRAQYPKLMEALKYNPNIVDDINERVNEEKRYSHQEKQHNLEDHKFISLASPNNNNLYDILIDYINQAEPSKKEESIDSARKLMDIFFAENIENIINYYGSSRGMTGAEISGNYLATVLNESKNFLVADKRIMFINELQERTEQKVSDILKKYESDMRWNDISATNYKELLDIISTRR
ncbi:MAG: tubulin-like doman-containing protein [Fusobacteriaceae bacterium]